MEDRFKKIARILKEKQSAVSVRAVRIRRYSNINSDDKKNRDNASDKTILKPDHFF